jgi:hypothetical protein
LVDRMSKINLIPKLMLDKMRAKDSLAKAREEEKELNKELKNIKDTLQSEDNPSAAEVKEGKKKDNKPAKDTQSKKPVQPDMLIPDRQKEPVLNSKDSVKS